MYLLLSPGTNLIKEKTRCLPILDALCNDILLIIFINIFSKVCDRGIAHAFVETSGTEVAQIVASWEKQR